MGNTTSRVAGGNFEKILKNFGKVPYRGGMIFSRGLTNRGVVGVAFIREGNEDDHREGGRSLNSTYT